MSVVVAHDDVDGALTDLVKEVKREAFQIRPALGALRIDVGDKLFMADRRAFGIFIDLSDSTYHLIEKSLPLELWQVEDLGKELFRFHTNDHTTTTGVQQAANVESEVALGS